MMSFIDTVLAKNPACFIDLASTGAFDLSPNMRHGVLEGAPPTVAGGIPSDGVFGRSRVFNGTNQLVRLKHSAGISPTSAITVLVALGAPTTPGYKSIISCTQSGGWNIEVTGASYSRFIVYRGGSYSEVLIPLDRYLPDTNLLICTYDGRRMNAYINGEAMTVNDLGTTSLIGYGSSIDTLIAAEPGAGSVPTAGGYSSGPYQYAGIFPTALTAEDAGEIYEAFISESTLSGVAVLDTGAPASAVKMRPWHDRGALFTSEAMQKGADIPVNPDGAWVCAAPPGAYELMFYGPSGYQPIAHGPVSPAVG